VKGHRSSSCKHTDRPLFEIKKKGRPVSQCEKCRELRQSKKMHSKCLCNLTEGLDMDPIFSQPPAPRKKPGRFVPITPSLPNGISDALLSFASGSVSSHSKQRVESLLNPCYCKSIWRCRCRKQSQRTRSETMPSIAANANPQNELAILAHAAMLQRDVQTSLSHTSPSDKTALTGLTRDPKRGSYRQSTPPNWSHKRRKHTANQRHKHTVPGPSLPPILLSEPSLTTSSHQIPDFPTIPPISTIASIAGSGCTCGLHCACPGCAEHREEGNASKDEAHCKDKTHCASGCATCVDWQGGIGLPVTTPFSATGVQSKSIINQFLERAATLPLPPHNRNRTTGPDIDPMNVMVYPADLFSNYNLTGTSNATSQKRAGAFNVEGREAVFGLVKVPKLECCGGRCGCPEDGCGCGKSCGGRCGERGNRRRSVSNQIVGSNGQASSQVVAPLAPRSCCAERLATGF